MKPQWIEKLAMACLAAMGIGPFFSTGLATIGYVGFLAIVGLEFLRDPKARVTTLQFIRSGKLWVPVSFLVGLAFLGIGWSIATKSIAWGIATKYLRLAAVLVIIPYLMQHPKCVTWACRWFVWAAALYCLFGHQLYKPGGRGAGELLVNPIVPGIAVACIMSFITINILTRNVNRVNLTQLIFFTVYLFLINQERTGPLASVVSLIVLCVNATILTYRNRRNSRQQRHRMLKNVLCVCVVRFIAVVVACRLLVPVVEKIVRYDAPQATSISRMEMLQQALRFIQESPWIGTGTGSYGTLLMQHHLPYIRTDRTSGFERAAHSHNEWDLWMIQWGCLGLFAFVLWFGYFAWYFFRARKQVFWASFGGILQVIFFVSGGCDAVFFVTIEQTMYVFGTCFCMAMIERERMRRGTLLDQQIHAA